MITQGKDLLSLVFVCYFQVSIFFRHQGQFFGTFICQLCITLVQSQKLLQLSFLSFSPCKIILVKPLLQIYLFFLFVFFVSEILCDLHYNNLEQSQIVKFQFLINFVITVICLMNYFGVHCQGNGLQQHAMCILHCTDVLSVVKGCFSKNNSCNLFKLTDNVTLIQTLIYFWDVFFNNFPGCCFVFTEEIKIGKKKKRHNKLTLFSIYSCSFYAEQEDTCC